MTCHDFVDAAIDLFEGDDVELRAELERHRDGCADCAAFVKTYEATVRASQAAFEVAFPPELQEQLEARIRAAVMDEIA